MHRNEKYLRPFRRSDCPISYSLEIFGDKWTLLVLRDLLLKKKLRFAELLSSDEQIATNILTDRLKRLEANGIIERERDTDDKRQINYRISDKGIDLIPVLLEIAAWGAKYDCDTGAPENFSQKFKNDRECVIAGYMDAFREK